MQSHSVDTRNAVTTTDQTDTAQKLYKLHVKT